MAADFAGNVLPSGTVSFAAGAATAVITVNVAGDTVVEGDELFTVTLSSPVGATITTAAASSTILNDDTVAPSLLIAADAASKSEGNAGSTPFTFTVTRSGDLSGTASASYAVSGAAVAGDFAGGVLPSGTVSFAAGAATAVITVNVAGDTVVEGNELFTVTLSSPVGATITTAAASSTILNDDATLAIAADAASKSEGNAGSTPFTFTVTRSGDLSGAASASYAVSGAAVAADFAGGVLPSGTVSFAAGAATAVITVNVAGDTVVEGNELFTVTLSSPVGATITTAAASSTILNDDATLAIAADAASKSEGNAGSTPFTFTVTRSGDLSGAASASYAVSGAAVAADFAGGVLPSGTVSFTAGAATAVITVNVAGDTVVEGNELFTVTLSSPVGATITTAAASSTILNDDATLAIAADAASKSEGNAGSTPFTFTVTRSGDLSGTASASYAVSGAAVAADFAGNVLPSGTVSFAAGAATAVITVNVAGDTVVEGDELFTVTLSSPVGATITTAAASSTILNDDTVAPSLLIAADAASKSEGNAGSTPFTFTVTRSGDLSGTASASYAVSGAAVAADFAGGVLPSGTVSFAAGAATAVITVNVAGDTVVEGNELFTVTLSSPVGATITTAAASSTILNDDATLAIAADAASKSEGNAGSTPFTFTVTRSGDLSGTASASYAVSGAAVAGDFAGGVLPSGTVSFAAGAATAVITVNVAGDTVVEGNELFTVTLSSPVGATITTAAASSTILNDDATLAIAADAASKSEGNAGSTPFTFTVTRSGDLSGAASASYAVSGAAVAADFAGGVLPSGTVSFAAGAATAVITVNVAGDTVVEGNELFTVTLSSPVGATITTAAASSTILNDDATLAIAADAASKSEGNAGSTPFTFTVTRSGDLSGTASASYAVSGAAVAADFAGNVLPSGTVSFAAGAATAVITVNVAGDTVVEGDELFTVTLSSPVGATITTAAASSTILNDDTVAPSLLIAADAASKSEGNAGTTPFTFTVTRSGDLSGTASASYAVSGAAVAADFAGGVLPSGTVSFTAGAATAVITVNVAGDTVVEGNELFTVTLSSPVGATITTAAASSTILNDDATLAIAADAASKSEGNAGSTPFTFTVTRSGDLSGTASASYAVSGAAVAGDFAGGVLPSGTVSFAAGAATAVITVNVAGDTVVEGNELFTVTLSSPVGATITTAAASSTILNDDATLAIAADAASKSEGNAGSTPFTFTVTRSGDLSGAASASYAVSGAAVAADFAGGVLPSGTVSFAAGAATAVITVNVAGDTVVEGNELFTVTLSSPVGATITTAAASSTILNDDATLAIAADAASKSEGNAGSTPFTFTVTRSGDLSGTASASYAVSGAAVAADFAGNVLPSGTVSFAAGAATAVITVNVAGDTVVEGDELFTVTLSSPVGATITTAAASSTILNDDTVAPSLLIAADAASKSEGNAGTTPFTFTVTRSGDLSGTASASYAVSGAAVAADFAGGVLPSGTVSFTAGAATAVITVNVAGDTVVEGNELFTVTLSSPVGATITTAAASSTILNDDATLAIAADAASKSEGNAGSTPFTFTVTRSGDLSGTASASYAVSGAAVAADFAGNVLPSGTVSFAAGAATAVITVNVAGDTVVEGDELFTVTLSSPVGATITTAAASSTILNDDTVAPSLLIAADAASKSEGNAGSTPFTFTVTRSGDLSGTASASYAVSGAAVAADFAGGVLPSGTVSFAAGAATAVITVNVAGDTVVEGNELFTVTLSSPVGATITTAAASSTILNDDATLAIAADAASKSEGNAGSTPFTFTVTRSGDLSGTASASYAVSGAAVAGDFAGGVLPSGTVSFAAGAATAVITVNVAGDTVVEGNELFTVTLSSPVGATITTAAASSTILNDDATLAIAADAASKSEGNAGSTPFTFTVTRSGDLSGAASASYAVSGAAVAADFAGGVLPSGTVSFAAGAATAVITVNVAGDTVVEGNELFTVTLSSPVGATITTAAASSTILNDDSVVTLRTIGEAGVFSRANPNAWRDAWLKEGVLISHRQNGDNASEAWLAANFGTTNPGTYGGSDIANGDLGVAGRTTGVQATPQEIDGTEALRFAFASAVSQLNFGFAAFEAGDRARIETYNASGSLLGSVTATSATAVLQGLSSVSTVVVRTEQGSFNVDKLSFG